MRGIDGDGAGRIECVLECKELAVEGDRRAVGQASQYAKALVHSASTRLRVDPADHDLVAVLAAEPDAEREPTRRELRDRRELAGNGDGVAQWQQIQADVHRQLSLNREQGGCADQPVGTRSDEEADVITDTQMVDARVGDLTERRAQSLRIAVGRFERVGEESDTDTFTHWSLRSLRAR